MLKTMVNTHVSARDVHLALLRVENAVITQVEVRCLETFNLVARARVGGVGGFVNLVLAFANHGEAH